MKKRIFCTIFTPTYNRKDTLPRLYTSLKNQTNFNFEWVIIDDGSTDNTEMLINCFKEQTNQFDIIYKKTLNGGKHRAINNGLDIANGKMFFIVDSDDYIVNNAIEIIEYYENSIHNLNEKFAGVSGLRKNSYNNIIGTALSTEFIDATNIEREKFNLIGDKAEVYYTDILKKYKFPEFEGENFLTESVIWNKIAFEGYKIRWFNVPICICDYRNDGLTQNYFKNLSKNLNGYLYTIKCDTKYLNLSILRKIQLYYNYYKLNKISTKINSQEISKKLGINIIYLYLIVILGKTYNCLKRHINEKRIIN